MSSEPMHTWTAAAAVCIRWNLSHTPGTAVAARDWSGNVWHTRTTGAAKVRFGRYPMVQVLPLEHWHDTRELTPIFPQENQP